MDEIEAKEIALRILIRDEVLNMIEDDSLGLHVRTVLVNMLKQMGFEELMRVRDGHQKTN